MEAVKCARGHYYDKALGKCPVCAAEGKRRGGVNNVHDESYDAVPPTMPDTGFDLNDGIKDTDPVTYPGFTPTDFVTDNDATDGWVVEDSGPTIFKPINDVVGFDPIVGWLICIKGRDRGKDYRLHSGTNFIGRSREMDVCIEGDMTVSSRKAASISYDDRSRSFFITRGEVRNLIYLNGKPVRSDADIVIYDRIEIGSTELMFVPLCGEQFNWQDI